MVAHRTTEQAGRVQASQAAGVQTRVIEAIKVALIVVLHSVALHNVGDRGVIASRGHVVKARREVTRARADRTAQARRVQGARQLQGAIKDVRIKDGPIVEPLTVAPPSGVGRVATVSPDRKAATVAKAHLT